MLCKREGVRQKKGHGGGIRGGVEKKSKKNLHFETVNIFQAVLWSYSMAFLLSHSLSFKLRRIC